MTWINVVSIVISLAVMVRAFNLFQESAMLPSLLADALQLVGVFSIMVTTIGLVALSVS